MLSLILTYTVDFFGPMVEISIYPSYVSSCYIWPIISFLAGTCCLPVLSLIGIIRKFVDHALEIISQVDINAKPDWVMVRAMPLTSPHSLSSLLIFFLFLSCTLCLVPERRMAAT